MGIGLALARHLVGLHRGTIAARNLDGHGSELLVRLPVIPTPPEPRPRDVAATPATKPCRILLVDDNADAAQAVQQVLSRSGHDVHVAADGVTALAMARQEPPQVIVLDIGLPDLDGLSVARQLRDDERTRGIPLIALTGYGRADDVARARAAGFDRHLTKPAEPEVLLRAISEATSDGRRAAGPRNPS